MANGDGARDHEARLRIAALEAKYSACHQAKERFEMAIEQTLESTNKKLDKQEKSIDELHGALKAWKVIIPLCMLLIAAVMLIINLKS